jgi:hypothetical protein
MKAKQPACRFSSSFSPASTERIRESILNKPVRTKSTPRRDRYYPCVPVLTCRVPPPTSDVETRGSSFLESRCQGTSSRANHRDVSERVPRKNVNELQIEQNAECKTVSNPHKKKQSIKRHGVSTRYNVLLRDSKVSLACCMILSSTVTFFDPG